MREAIRLARENVQSGEGGPFGAIVVKNGEIVGQGANKVTSVLDPTAHAEILAIRDACQNMQTFQLTDCIVYTSCEPCPMCLGALYWARPDKFYYAGSRLDAAGIDFDDQFIYDEMSLPVSGRKLPGLQLLRDEALKVFQLWESDPDKTPY